MITHTIPRDVAVDLHEIADTGKSWHGYTPVHDEQVDTRRWVSVHRLIIRRDSDGTLWQALYEQPLTEYQDCEMFPGDPVTVTLVRAEQVVTTRYVVATEPAGGTL